MLESYFAAALALPVWRPIFGGMIGFLGISLEFLGLMTLYPLLKRNMPKGAALNVFRLAGNYALVNGLATSNKSIGVIILFIALYVGFGKYVRQENLQ